MNNRKLVTYALSALSTLLLTGPAIAQQGNAMKDALAEISKSCEDQGRILAEAKISKWKKAGQNVEERLGPNSFAVVRQAMHLQCVSIQHVSLLRLMKSQISTDEARRMDIDGEIARQMEIIERTL